jgi:hypothetical protein
MTDTEKTAFDRMFDVDGSIEMGKWIDSQG